MSGTPTTSWDETLPAGSDALNQGDNRIRELKQQVREVLDVDHQFNSSGSDVDNGKHNKVSLIEAADIGSGANTRPILGAQTINSKPELTFTTEDDVDIQITKVDKINLDAGRLSNNVTLKGRNAADNADIDIIKVNASNTIEVPVVVQLKNASVMESSAAPTTDPMIANKKYVDDKVSAIVIPSQAGFGAWSSSFSNNTAYLAATDGIVTAWCSGGSSGSTIDGYTDSSASPSTQRAHCSGGSSSAGSNLGLTMPVRKGDYWKISVTQASLAAINFLPLGS